VLRIRDVYPASRILTFIHTGSRISDPGSNNSNKRGGRSLKFYSIEKYFIFEQVKKKISQFNKIIVLLTQKTSLSSQKYGFEIRDPGSGKNIFRIPDPGVKKAPDPGSGSATLPLSDVNAELFHIDGSVVTNLR
jgi:hypothetical protein